MLDRTIQAAILSQEQPPRVIVNEAGDLPELQHAHEHGTVEDTFYRLGRDVLGRTVHVSVDQAFPHNGKTVYQSEPVPPATVPIHPYAWADCPPILPHRP